MLTRILAIAVLLSSKGNCKSVAPSTKVDHKNVGVELILEEANEKRAHAECFKSDHDSLGNDLSDRPIKGVTSPKECQNLCKEDPSCFYFAVNLRNDPIENNGCWLKRDVGSPPRPRIGVIFGPKHCHEETKKTSSTDINKTDDIEQENNLSKTDSGNEILHEKEHDIEKNSNHPMRENNNSLNIHIGNTNEGRHTKDQIHVLQQLEELVNFYRKNYQELPKDRNTAKDLEFVKKVAQEYASPKTMKNFKSVEIRKPGKPLRFKRSSINCKDDDCKAQVTEKDFQNLEREATELMQQLEAEYSQMQEKLINIDQKILENRF